MTTYRIKEFCVEEFMQTHSRFDILAQHYFFLAYQESGPEAQANSDISIDTVLNYCSPFAIHDSNGIAIFGAYCDCIDSRMMKLEIELKMDSCMVCVRDFKTRPDHQSWSTGQFKTFDALLQQAAKNANIELIPVQS